MLLSATLSSPSQVSPLRPKPDREGTVEVEHILRDFGLILGAGLLSQLAATLLRISEMIVLVVGR